MICIVYDTHGDGLGRVAMLSIIETTSIHIDRNCTQLPIHPLNVTLRDQTLLAGIFRALFDRGDMYTCLSKNTTSKTRLGYTLETVGDRISNEIPISFCIVHQT
jgi:hypothetical protein